MKQIMALAFVAVVVSVATPQIIKHLSAMKASSPVVEANDADVGHLASVEEEVVRPARKAANPYEGRKEVLRASSNGHFYTTARLNRRTVKVLVDTGATSVAMDEDVARRLGVRLKESDFKYTVGTANGQTRAAMAMLDEVSIGRVVVKNVKVAVIKRGKLDVVLLGMSFLNKLKSFEVTNGELVLTQ